MEMYKEFKNIYINKNLDFLFFFFLLLITFFSVLTQYLFKYIPELEYKNLYITIGIILYSFIGFCNYKLLKYGDIIIINIVYHIVYFLSLFLIGFFYMGDKISFKKMIAILFGIISVILFLIEGIH